MDVGYKIYLNDIIKAKRTLVYQQYINDIFKLTNGYKMYQ